MEQTISHAIKSLYIHIPFCEKRCYYCDFVSSAHARSDLMALYVERIVSQLSSLSQAELLSDIETIYIGGGTPSYLEISHLDKLLSSIKNCVMLDRIKEYSVEANPESLNEQKLKLLLLYGVNRVSLGVQSFNDKELKAIGRIHSSQTAQEVMALLDQYKLNYSIDLMCGLPYQSQESFLESLRVLKGFNLSHLSVYPLTIEPGTVLDKMIESGTFDEPSDDFEADALELVEDLMSQHGFKRYEIASYAKVGCESLHNRAYWSGKSYLGLGSGAALMIYPEYMDAFAHALGIKLPVPNPSTARIRLSFNGDIKAYATQTIPHISEIEYLNFRELFAEDLMLAFRKTEGISFKHLEGYLRNVPELKSAVMETLQECMDLNLVKKTSEAYVPSEKAWLLGNELFGRLWDLHESAN